ncbi:MAG: 8-amino-7-oxononanoate synthase [Nitrospira sp.]|nr:8-amino-7-oxononanoate synthase [Nitrospira sp.]
MFQEKLRQMADESLTRRLRVLSSGTGATVQFGGRSIILLCSNDYLGLAMHPAVIHAAVRATELYGSGAGASRLVCGTLPPHEELESALARFKGTEAALLFGSGYLANLGIIPRLIDHKGLILADRLCHASLIDGCRLSGATFRVYRHRDSSHVESLLKRRSSNRPALIVTDGLFSMDGDLAPLPELAVLAKRYDAMLYVDDAHGSGIMGVTGRGTLEHFGVEREIDFHMGTLGKAMGSSGAYLAGSRDIVEYLLNTARPFLFTTASPPSTAAAAGAALAVIQQEPERRSRLWSNRHRLFHGLQQIGFRMTETVSPILPILIGDAAVAVAFAEHLLAHGVYAPAIRPPTVPDHTSRIRVTVTSEHTTDHIDAALRAFESAGRATGLL